jgi:CspA family cold shock protein
MSCVTAPSSERFTGRVKWFNNKAGYGFVTVTDGSNAGKDVFVHHTSIKVDSEQYKYLVQGEYIEFTLSAANGEGGHEFQAGDVSGIKGGKLMCETRRETRSARFHYSQSTTTRRTPSANSPPVSNSPPVAVRESSSTTGRGSGRGSSAGRGTGRGRGRPPKA